MTTREAMKLIGKTGLWQTIEGFILEVEIKDFKNTWGKNRFQIVPVHGGGEIWTETMPAIKE